MTLHMVVRQSLQTEHSSALNSVDCFLLQITRDKGGRERPGAAKAADLAEVSRVGLAALMRNRVIRAFLVLGSRSHRVCARCVWFENAGIASGMASKESSQRFSQNNVVMHHRTRDAATAQQQPCKAW